MCIHIQYIKIQGVRFKPLFNKLQPSLRQQNIPQFQTKLFQY